MNEESLLTKILQNYIYTGLLLLGISAVSGLLVGIFGLMFNVGFFGSGLVGGILSPMLLGKIYVQKFKRATTHEFKLKAIGVYVVAQLALALPIGIFLLDGAAIIILSLIGLVVLSFTYYLLSSAEQTELRRLQK